ncbi:MAG: molecular chaperone HscC, partial [Oscillospiraceae bacterium]|nr:molecular chaperone HscC [Oscillospiraceae bacterium]
MAIIGIDLGTTNSLAAVWKDGASRLIPNALGEYLTPSAVSIDEDGTVLVGATARQRVVSHPGRSAASFKRSMGTDKVYQLADRSFTPEELSALVLRQLKADAEAWLGEPVEEAVISVPAYFNDRQRAATKRAGQLAGLRVERLVNEPSAAALSCYEPDKGEASFLVFDFGGGTLDVSVVECFDNVVNILAVSGDNRLGGNDFDQIIARLFCVENGLSFSELDNTTRAILLEQAENCKQALSHSRMAMMVLDSAGAKGAMTLDGKKLVDHSQDLLKRMRTPIAKALRDSGVGRSELAGIIPVGGSCKMPLVQQYLTHLMGKPPRQNARPDTAVALGAGMYAAMKERKAGIAEMVLTDICPFTLGT